MERFPTADASRSALITAVREKAVGDFEPDVPVMEVGMVTVHVP